MTYATIEGFEELSAQEVFDRSKDHLLKQGVRSASDFGRCKYRGPEGLMCAAGIFLRPESAAGCEDKGWLDLRDRGRVPSTHADLVRELQYIHDATPTVS